MRLRDVSRRYGTKRVLHGVSLDVPADSFTSVLGPSGCGKSTALRIMAGLDRPDSGLVSLGGRDVGELSASERNVAMVFQSYALYPHLSVADNIALPLAMRHLTLVQRLPLVARLSPAARRTLRENRRHVERVAESLGIAELLERKPGELSGGQKQRVAVGRALVRDPAVFLLDEPLSNLDAQLRVQMREELVALRRRTGKPFVYVTHDQAEAMSLSDRVVVLMDGEVRQSDTPRAIYRRPEHLSVARFVGAHPINEIPLELAGGRLGPPFEHLGAVAADGAEIVLAIRPEHLAPSAAGRLAARVERVEFLGGETVLHLRRDGLALRALAGEDLATPAPGESVRLRFRPEHVHLYDARSGARVAHAGEPRA